MVPLAFPTQRGLEAKSKAPRMEVAGGLEKLAEKMHLFGEHVAFTRVIRLFERTPVFRAALA